MQKEAKFQVQTWNQIYATLRNQTEKICQSDFKPDVAVCVTRDGWVPARILSDLLGIRALPTTRVEFYVGIAET
jgi:hypoxanthine phosphoribosyltransferase